MPRAMNATGPPPPAMPYTTPVDYTLDDEDSSFGDLPPALDPAVHDYTLDDEDLSFGGPPPALAPAVHDYTLDDEDLSFGGLPPVLAPAVQQSVLGLNDLPGSNVYHPNFIPSDRAATIAQSLEEEFFSGELPPRQPHMIYGNEGHARRDMVWLGEPHADDGMLPLYRFLCNPTGGQQPNPCTYVKIRDPISVPSVMPSWLVELMVEVQEALSLPHRLNHIVLHRYLHAEDNIGAHHDKYTDMVPGSSIVCLSFGETRTFAIHEPKAGRGDGPTVARGDVSEGDAVCMSYDFNRRYKHALRPKLKHQNDGARFSITARSIATHFDLDRRLFRVWGDATLRSFS